MFLAAVIGTLVGTLAAIGALVRGDVAVIASFAVSVGAAVFVARSQRLAAAWSFALAASVTRWTLVGVLCTPVFSPHLLSRPEMFGLWVLMAVAYTVAFAPLARLLHRGADLDAADATDRAALAASWWLYWGLAEAVSAMTWTQAFGGHYTGLAAPALGPALLGTFATGTLLALVALLRSARWIAMWRALPRGDRWRTEDPALHGDVSALRRWFVVRGGDAQRVLIRRVAQRGGTYREGVVEVLVARVPADRAAVTRALVTRALCAALLLAGYALAARSVAALRW